MFDTTQADESLRNGAAQPPTPGGELEFRYGNDEQGKAVWCSVGRDGACIRMGRYLRPGRHVLLIDYSAGELPAEFSGGIVWCRPGADGRSYIAGVYLFDDGRSRPMFLTEQWEMATAVAAS